MSTVFSALSAPGKAAIDSVPDAQQFPASAAASGAESYGRFASQGSESHNSATLPGRNLDPLQCILWHTAHAQRKFLEFKQAAHAHTDSLTPKARERLSDLLQGQFIGMVTRVQNEGTVAVRVWRVTVNERVSYKVRLSYPTAVRPSLFPRHGNACDCGVPRTTHFVCSHMVLVARKINAPEHTLVPQDLWTSAWREQFPLDLTPAAPTIADVRASEMPEDSTLRLPITAPPKRGRPSKKRRANAMTAAVKRLQEYYAALTSGQ